jgi:hypothetical protein
MKLRFRPEAVLIGLTLFGLEGEGLSRGDRATEFVALVAIDRGSDGFVKQAGT